ncbi:MAG: TolC family protein, partial [Massilia sp.]
MSPLNPPARMAGRCALATIAIAALTACGTLPPGQGLNQVSALTAERIGQPLPATANETDQHALAQVTKDILSKPISADDAVRLAVLNSPTLRSSYASVGIAQADLMQAGRLSNPSLTFQRTRAGAQVEIERSLGFNLVNLLTAPLARRIETGRFEQTRLLVASQVIAHAAQTRSAYYSALAARQEAQYARQVSDSAGAGAELAMQMNKVGNMSGRELAREQAFAAEARAALLKAELQANTAREALTVLMGLSGADAGYLLPERLPELPDRVDDLGEIEQLAVNQRLDVRAATVEAEQTATSLGLVKRTRLVNVLDLAYVNNSATGQPSAPGYAITLEL